MFKVQSRDERGRWRDNMIGAHHTTLQGAIDRITSCDPDGWFNSDMRVYQMGAGVVYTAEDWRKSRDLDA